MGSTHSRRRRRRNAQTEVPEPSGQYRDATGAPVFPRPNDYGGYNNQGDNKYCCDNLEVSESGEVDVPQQTER